MSFTHSPARSTGGIVASAHPLASGAGGEMLRAGGNVFDAVVAPMATLNVVVPCWVEAERRVRL
jgi:gamma-glutamyltranspeptidase/glutathione hydrolase